MTHDEMSEKVDGFINEYFQAGEFDYLNGEDGLRRKTKDELEDLMNRIDAFFEENDVPDDLNMKYARSGVGESYYMSQGYGYVE